MTRRQEIRNQIVNPYSRRASIWTWNCVSTPLSDGRYLYAPKDPSKEWAFAALQDNYQNRYGHVEIAIIGHEVGVDGKPTSISGSSWVQTGDLSDTVSWVAGQLRNTGTLYHEIQYAAGRDLSVTLLGAALYTPDDWTAIEQLMVAGKIPGPWTAPPMSTTSGVRTLPVLIP